MNPSLVRSDRAAGAMPPAAKPIMRSVKGSDASARAMPNSASMVGMTTATDHKPTPPIVVMTSEAMSRSQA